MISFKTFITEARLAPLYHGVQIGKLESILTHGLRPSTIQTNTKLLKPFSATNIKSRNAWLTNIGQEPDPKDQSVSGVHSGVSLTRSKKFATTWPGRAESFVVFELDQDALARRYQIKPLQYWSSAFSPTRKKDHTGDRNEYEEFVITTKPIDIKYITRIYYKFNDSTEKKNFNPDTLTQDEAKELIEKMSRKYTNIKFIELK